MAHGRRIAGPSRRENRAAIGEWKNRGARNKMLPAVFSGQEIAMNPIAGKPIGCVALVLAACCAWIPAGLAQGDREHALTKKDPQEAEVERRVDEMMTAVVRVKMRALPDARSNATLGPAREGSGIAIEPGWVLTIGYLVIESDAIEVSTSANRTLPALLAGYDHATGFGLLKVQGDLGVKPLPLGESAALAVREPVIIVPHGGKDTASLAYVMSKRRFTGSWEYLLDSAIFTSPPSYAWAGAALVNRDLRLVGVGSLLVRDTVEPGVPQPGNMFVPIDLLKPILAQLKDKGRVAGKARPWLGLATEEVQGRLFVTRVSPESPADLAGIEQGDIVMSVGGDAVKTHVELYQKVWALGAAGVEVPIKVLHGADVRDVRVRSIDRFEYFREKKPL
jgi:S1-C subfamily serine protease